MRKITFAIPFAVMIMILALSAPAWAGPFDMNLSLFNPVQFAGQGSTVSFTATVSAPIANAGPVYLVSDSSTIDYPLTLDDSGFFFGFPTSLDPGGSFTGELFTVAIPKYTPLGQFNGYFEIDGGADANASDLLASVTFGVTVVPEPGSFLLLITGLSGLAFAVRRRRSQH